MIDGRTPPERGASWRRFEVPHGGETGRGLLVADLTVSPRCGTSACRSGQSTPPRQPSWASGVGSGCMVSGLGLTRPETSLTCSPSDCGRAVGSRACRVPVARYRLTAKAGLISKADLSRAKSRIRSRALSQVTAPKPRAPEDMPQGRARRISHLAGYPVRHICAAYPAHGYGALEGILRVTQPAGTCYRTNESSPYEVSRRWSMKPASKKNLPHDESVIVTPPFSTLEHPSLAPRESLESHSGPKP